ncbi:MAG TPA: PQ-loop domain-containing transporter [Candidatus Bilamarchaeum sp.]|nr:PQ-loop domain-containing transporter [Candidatus Bilamarchaeum sp.]
MPDGIHHLHKRKRIHELNQPYPHPDKWMNRLDSLVFIVAFFSVLMTVPQAFQIWTTHSAAGVSLASWGAYSLSSMFWVIYGIAHREKMIVAVYALFALLNLSVVAGILVYG